MDEIWFSGRLRYSENVQSFRKSAKQYSREVIMRTRCLQEIIQKISFPLTFCCYLIITMACVMMGEGITLNHSGVTSTSVQFKKEPAPSRSLVTKPAAWDDMPDGHKWTEFTHDAIENFGSNLLIAIPKDVYEYCPAYDDLNREERRSFWVYLLSSISFSESNHDPNGSFTENFIDSQGNPVISRGLLQISKESANVYSCDISDETELNDPETNIHCGVRILNHWVAEQDGVVADQRDRNWLGAARYWSSFRNEYTRLQIASMTASQSYCLCRFKRCESQ